MAGESTEPSTTSTVVTSAVRDAARFDRSLVSPTGGLLAAIPVAAVLAIGTAAGSPVHGVIMAAGAMLVGIAWRVRGGRAPLALMATDAALMALSTFVGSVTGSIEWLHLLLLCLWALVGGLMVALGPGGGVIGTQALLAAIIFGRFSQSPAAALGLAALVVTGAAAQVVFQALVRWPSALRSQRQAVAAAYRALASVAAAPPDEEASTLAAAASLDEANIALAAPALFGDPALLTLRSLVDEGRRLRLQLAAARSLLSHGEPPAALEDVARVLDRAAQAIEGDHGAAEELRTLSVPVRTALGDLPPAVALPLSRRLAALGGQLRAVGTLAATAGEGGGLRSRRPRGRGDDPLARLRSNLAALRANASLGSPAGRHAVRLAVLVVAVELIARHIPLQRTYWLVVASVTTIRPEFGATFTRGSERVLGTVAGVALAGAITVGLHPSGGATVVLVGGLAWAAYSVFPASFAAGFGFITALVVFLLNAISPDTLATASARLLDTLIGGAIGLAVYALWPTWGRQPARDALADLIAAIRAYLDAVLTGVVAGRRARPEELGPLSRQTRLARTRAESAVAVSLSEPQTRRIDADQTRGALGALRRLVYSVHVVRLEWEEDRPRRPLPALRPLLDGLDRLLLAAEASLRGEAIASALPDLRAAYDAFEHAAPGDEETGALLLQLDEIVDAADTLAAVLELDPADPGCEAASIG